MTGLQRFLIAAVALVFSLASAQVFASDVSHSTPGVGGYDPVAYFTDGKPMRGSGYHVAVHEGVTYAFASAEHKKAFEKDPAKFLPAYGGYCAYGVAVGKKFVADPEVWRIVDGKLYLNLDKGIQGKWEKDVPGYIRKADGNWKEIRDKAPGAL